MIIPDYRDFQHSNELYHFGIKGKSGRYPLGSGERPYQDYPEKRRTLSKFKKRKKIKSFEKESEAAANSFKRNKDYLYEKASDKVQDYMTNQGLKDFNDAQKKRYGENFTKRSGYVDDLIDTVDDLTEQQYKKDQKDFMISNKHYKKALSIVKDYKIDEWDGLSDKTKFYLEKILGVENFK